MPHKLPDKPKTQMILMYLGPRDTLDLVQSNIPQYMQVMFAADAKAASVLIKTCDVVLDASLQIPFSGSTLTSAQNLKLFVTASTGASHIDEDTLTKRGIPLLTLRDKPEIIKSITPAAEHSWLLLLACARRLPGALQEVLQGNWDRTKYPGITIKGKTLGIIGCGRIGNWMATYAMAFGMKCLGCDPYVNEWPNHIAQTALPLLLSSSDFITVHVPLSNETRKLIGAPEISQIKPGAIFINTSRGEIVDEEALLRALEDGQIAAAGLDVLSGEPEIARHPLVEYARSHDNLLLTPHIGGFSPEALRYLLAVSCRRITDFFGLEK